MKAKTFDRKYDSGEKIAEELGLSKARRVATDAKWFNVDFPVWMVASLDREARRIGVHRKERHLLVHQRLARLPSSGNQRYATAN